MKDQISKLGWCPRSSYSGVESPRTTGRQPQGRKNRANSNGCRERRNAPLGGGIGRNPAASAAKPRRASKGQALPRSSRAVAVVDDDHSGHGHVCDHDLLRLSRDWGACPRWCAWPWCLPAAATTSRLVRAGCAKGARSHSRPQRANVLARRWAWNVRQSSAIQSMEPSRKRWCR